MLIYHVVGEQGVGKSMLSLAMAERFQARGLVCAGHHPEIFTTLQEAQAQRPGADVYFVEHQGEPEVEQVLGANVFVIRIEQVQSRMFGPSANRAQVPQGAAHG